MKKQTSLIYSSTATFRAPFERRISQTLGRLTKKERLVFFLLAGLLLASAIGLLWKVNREFMVEIPVRGGTLTEGVIGTPGLINPLLAPTDADRDIVALVYSGLMRATNSGALEPDLAESYNVSDDGLTYTFIIKENAIWHDGKPITADDVIFTIEKARETAIDSTKRANWSGITVEKINNLSVRFTLKEPYAPFLENTTMGLLPKHIWRDVSSEQFKFSKYNIEPIGSGPYRIKNIKKERSGAPKYYDLISFKSFTLGGPYLNNIRIKFYPTVDDLLKAFKNGDIDSINSIAPQIAQELEADGYRVESVPFPRVFGVFFNQNQAKIFADKAVRQALDTAIDKDLFVADVLYGYGTALNSPIPPGTLGYTNRRANDEFATEDDRAAYARQILETAGWEFDEEKIVMVKNTKKEVRELSFSLSTSDVPELKDAAELLKRAWEKIGARVEIKISEVGGLKENVIRTRKYDALLFGEILGRSSDLFAFWHSSQRLDPGLNVAMYANITVDKLLEETRIITSTAARIEKYIAFENEVIGDIPSIFLYSPDFIYVLPSNIKGVELGGAGAPSERFLGVDEWHIKTNMVWKIFVKE